MTLKCRVTGCEATPTYRCPTATEHSASAVECGYHIVAMHNYVQGSLDQYLIDPSSVTPTPVTEPWPGDLWLESDGDVSYIEQPADEGGVVIVTAFYPATLPEEKDGMPGIPRKRSSLVELLHRPTLTTTNTEETDMPNFDSAIALAEQAVADLFTVTPTNVVLNYDPDPILTEEALRGVKTGEWLIRKDGTLFQVTDGARQVYGDSWVLKLQNGYGDYSYNLQDLRPGGYNGDLKRISSRDPLVTAALRARTINTLTSEMEEFKAKVVEVAREYGAKHNMCSVLAEALSELGLEITNRKRVTVEVVVDAEWGEDATADDIQNALTNGDWNELSQEDGDDD